MSNKKQHKKINDYHRVILETGGTVLSPGKIPGFNALGRDHVSVWRKGRAENSVIERNEKNTFLYYNS